MNLICSECGVKSTHVLNLGHYQYVCARCKTLLQADVTRESIDNKEVIIAPCTCAEKKAHAATFRSHDANSIEA